jgi:hypothetical protein
VQCKFEIPPRFLDSDLDSEPHSMNFPFYLAFYCFRHRCNKWRALSRAAWVVLYGTVPHGPTWYGIYRIRIGEDSAHIARVGTSDGGSCMRRKYVSTSVPKPKNSGHSSTSPKRHVIASSFKGSTRQRSSSVPASAWRTGAHRVAESLTPFGDTLTYLLLQ